MAEPKTKVTDADVEGFLNSIENERRRQDGFHLLEIYKRVTGLEPEMWGPSIVGFGTYHYKSERSSQEGTKGTPARRRRCCLPTTLSALR
jgi:hypothetical protein